ncbi:hypothetical protein DH2020_012906 [Rehmannia glutinosa]|uniref:Protein NBR1 homolog n=1 Tax=Rehmannia glutinosa TaxID=99300 RepID=A0ABR0X3T9_REHGL
MDAHTYRGDESEVAQLLKISKHLGNVTLPTMDASSVVIKVKYGDTLRRFNAQVVEDELNLSMDGLRKKIRSLFSFDPDTELMLTYVDEDNDVVTLVDDDDLRDVVKQALNPLRITVKVDADKSGGQYNRSSASSTPLRSPRVKQPSPNLSTGVPEILRTLPEPLYETLMKLSADLASKASSSAGMKQPLQNLNTGVSQILRTVPEPLREPLTKLSADLASKASSSAPGITELVDHFSKVGLSYLDQLSQSQSGVKSSSTQGDIPESSTAASETKDSELKPEATRGNNVLKIHTVSGGSVKESSKNINVVQPGNDYLPRSAPVHPEAAVTSHSLGKKEKLKRLLNQRQEVCNPGEPKLGPTPSSVGASDPTTGDYVDDRMRSALSDGFRKSLGSLWAPSPGSSNFPGSFSGPSPTYECPYSGIVMGNGLAAPSVPASEAVPFRRSISQNDGSGNIFHRGVRCDGCGVHPITGPRKVDYDLCSICFEEMGNDRDYTRLDRPVVYRHHMSFKGLHDARARDWSPNLQQVYRGSMVKLGATKLDSRFIQDVNIFDGTVMAPLIPFTKIWCMRNNGTVAWPQKTQLVWIGGDKLSNELSVEVQIPAAGLMINQELEVAVEFISPELPGRYISYWRMASPSGQKFGQRVWVLIQVDASVKETPRENVRNLNLNLPPVSSSLTGPEIINVEPEPVVSNNQSGVDNSKKKVELVQPITEQELKFPINDNLLVGNGALSSLPSSSASPPVSYPIIDLSDVAPVAIPVVSPPMLYPPQAPKPSASEATGASGEQSSAVDLPGMEVEEKLLRELEAMGFKQVDLNKEILRMNEYDLEQAVNDLCGVAEWDPMLEELQEMGFHDTEMNKMLLKKNNGSIKRVVMDLIAGEKI